MLLCKTVCLLRVNGGELKYQHFMNRWKEMCCAYWKK